MSRPRSRAGVHYVLAAIWLLYTMSLAAWWLSVGLTVTERKTMFLLEGATFFIVLVAGGFALIVAIRREHRRRQALEMFFMSFTHDLKTSLARVQLQAEGLREDCEETTAREPLDRLLHDTLRLQIQLENSLFVAQPDGRLLCERIDVAGAVRRLEHDWPELAIDVVGQAAVLADARAFDAVLRNLIQNAVLHGGATAVSVNLQRPGGPVVRIVVEDNGRGVDADALAQLGEPFARPGETSGTGVGLYVCRLLVKRMKGSMSFLQAHGGSGLRVVIDLPEAH